MRPTTTRNIRVFAGLREHIGETHVSLSVPESTTAAELKDLLKTAHPAAAHLIDACRVAVDEHFVEEAHPIGRDAQIALIPPVSGGHTGAPASPLPQTRGRALLCATPLDPEAVREAVAHDGAGGITSFVGNVRAQARGLVITHLEYEAYPPMAVRVMDAIATAIEGDIEGARVAIHHRVGRLEVGETAVVIAASAPHRAEAFDACRRAIEALKQDVPIWKKEFDAEGGTWIGQGP